MDIVGWLLVGSLIALVVIAVVGPQIKKESPGPILFKQTRTGLNGKRFMMLKLRTMYVNADERQAELMKENRLSDGMMFKMDWVRASSVTMSWTGKKSCQANYYF